MTRSTFPRSTVPLEVLISSRAVLASVLVDCAPGDDELDCGNASAAPGKIQLKTAVKTTSFRIAVDFKLITAIGGSLRGKSVPQG